MAIAAPWYEPEDILESLVVVGQARGRFQQVAGVSESQPLPSE